MKVYRCTLAGVLGGVLLGACFCSAQVVAKYDVRLVRVSPPKFEITAVVEMIGPMLAMDETRPADVPEVGQGGWPALVSELSGKDLEGNPLKFVAQGASGWNVSGGQGGRVFLHYFVDYSLLAKNNWPAPREAAYQDPNHIVGVGRSLFVTPKGGSDYQVKFQLPQGWRAVVPWKVSDGKDSYEVASAAELTENLLVFSREAPEVIRANRFTIFATELGPWISERAQVKKLLAGVLPRYVAIFGTKDAQRYSVVLLPQEDSGGESYRGSFAFNFASQPTNATFEDWGHTIAHEVFHHWNGWALRGKDYASTQWFQEGFTDYSADRAMLDAGLISPEQFRHRLALYVEGYKNLKTPMARPGSHKGPPLYSAGALVAFAWDVEIRSRTGLKRDLNDVIRTLWRETDEGEKPYDWNLIMKALQATAQNDWQSFYDRFIDGGERLPLASIFQNAGLRMSGQGESGVVIEPDAVATAEQKRIWESFSKSARVAE